MKYFANKHFSTSYLCNIPICYRPIIFVGYTKDVLRNTIEHDYICCDTDLVINGCLLDFKLSYMPFMINDTHKKKLGFTQFRTRMAAWLPLTFFMCLHNQLSSIHSAVTYYRCLKNVIHQIDTKNEWLLLSASFTAKFRLVFVLTLENAFS